MLILLALIQLSWCRHSLYPISDGSFYSQRPVFYKHQKNPHWKDWCLFTFNASSSDLESDVDSSGSLPVSFNREFSPFFFVFVSNTYFMNCSWVSSPFSLYKEKWLAILQSLKSTLSPFPNTTRPKRVCFGEKEKDWAVR